jgi:CBS domain-containing protein
MQAARKVAALKQIALLLVEDEDVLVGVLDERALALAANDACVADVVKPLNVYLRPDMSIAHARDVFNASRLPILPVVAGGFVLGAIAWGDIDRALWERRSATERTALPVR